MLALRIAEAVEYTAIVVVAAAAAVLAAAAAAVVVVGLVSAVAVGRAVAAAGGVAVAELVADDRWRFAADVDVDAVGFPKSSRSTH